MHKYEEEQNKFFSERFEKFGFNIKTLHWESPFTQRARFVELLKVCTFFPKDGPVTLLDFGCGLGHLYEFIKENDLLNSWKIKYTGIDINGDLINECKKQFPGADFKLKDDSLYGENYDFILCSGIFNLKFSEDLDIDAHYINEIKKLFEITNHAVAVNFQSDKALPLIPEKLREGEKKKFYFHNKETVLNNLKNIAANIKVSEGYLVHDFTVYLLK